MVRQSAIIILRIILLGANNEKTDNFLELTRPEKERKTSLEEDNFNFKELFVRDNRSQRKNKSVKQKYNTLIYEYGNTCKDCTCILGKIYIVVVRNESKLQPNFGLLDIF